MVDWQPCFDGDRLDLVRVNIKPNSEKMTMEKGMEMAGKSKL